MKIVFVAPYRHWTKDLYAVDSITAFAKKGYEVDVITTSACEPEYKPDHPKVNPIFFHDKHTLFDRLQIPFFLKVFSYGMNNSYDLAIGMAERGLAAATFLLVFRKRPVTYVNTEIFTGYEKEEWFNNKVYNRIWKAIERFCNHRATLTITQDSIRADLLAKINRIPRESIMTLPNSGSGRAARKKSDYLQRKFRIPKESNILISIGGIFPGSGFLELAEEAKEWPEEFRLVFHIRHTVDPKKYPYTAKVLSLADYRRVYISKLVSYEILTDIVASSRIGLALYEDTGPGISWMGYSSGRISFYLKLGIPIIVQNLSGLRWVEDSGAGICVSGPQEVLDAAKKIIANYNLYSENALKTFEEQLSFDRAFEVIENRVRKILIDE